MRKHIGRVIKLGDHIDTDIIIPTQYMTLETIEEMAQYAFSPLRPEIPSLVQQGDILVCGKDFGCGSSREQAPEIIKVLGVYCIVAKSFARIFYRNAINNGLLVIESAEIYDHIQEGEQLTVDAGANQLITASGKAVPFGKIPDMLLEMIQSGGLVNYYKAQNQSQGTGNR
jgi:3-isopropylmalate/(R)-2-methylmalate dehydratase small subunit